MTLAAALTYLREEVRPRAQAIDRDPAVLQLALDGLFDRRLMTVKAPAELGGAGFDAVEFRTFQEEVARASGTLAFLQTQHQSAAAMLSKCDRPEIVPELIESMTTGERRIGVGFSQLRRSGPPIMRAVPTNDGYKLDGEVPWVTGLGFYQEFLLGATEPSGECVFLIVPLENRPGLTVSPPMRLASMESAQTVSVRFEGYVVKEDAILMRRPKNFIAKNDTINISLQGQFLIGCALAGVDVIRQAAIKRGLDFLDAAAARLDSEILECRDAMERSQDSLEPETAPKRLKLRAWAIDLAVRCAHAAIAASSGAANSLDHPAQRIYREALVFTVSAQTTDIMRATIDRLSERSATTEQWG